MTTPISSLPSPRILRAGHLLRYVMAGGAAAVVHLAVLAIAVEAAGLPSVAGSAVGFAAAIAVNYTAQYYWVFGATARHGAAFPRYLAVTLAMLGVNSAMFAALVGATSLHYIVVQVLVTATVTALNYVINAGFTYRRSGAAR